MDKYLGKRLEGRYDILELIGSGGMANVYRAHDVIDDRTVAVKILRDEFIGNNEFIRRFKNESKAIALLNHPNIVRVYDVSFTNRIHSIVMEYIDGISLKDFISHKHVLTPRETIHFTMQILNALQHAHDKGIVHRDIKPQNIMLLRSGQIKVTDFGIARFARSEVRTITDRAIGSVHYISPEQAMGENTDEKSDLYSVGVMMFEMLTGQLPFEADTAVSVAIKQVQTQAQRPREINPDIPPGLEEIVMRAMEKNPAYRYQSAAEMMNDIRAFQNNPRIRFNYQAKQARQENKKQKRTMKQKSRTPYLKVLFVVTLAIAIGSAGFVGLMVYLNNPFKLTPPIPSLYEMEGERLEDIESRHYNLTLDVKEEFDNTIPNGVVIEQRPKAGTEVKEGSTVRLTVSKGPKSITIPNFIGFPASRSINELRDLGLVVEEQEDRVFDDNVPVGCIVSLDPPPETVVASGTTISLAVSKGTEVIPISVPNVMNIGEESAKAQIEAAGFTLGGVTFEDHELPEGYVIRQSPPPGDLQLKDTPIHLVISKGGLKNYTLRVPLPLGMDREVLVRARLGEEADKIADEATLTPAQDEDGYWFPVISGGEDEEVKVTIYVDRILYMQYMLDFSTGESWVVYDNSNRDEFSE